MAIVSVTGVTIGFGGFALLDGIELQIERHERICLLGRNGSGKTTLMRLINGEILPDAGVVARGQGIRTARLSQEIPDDVQGTVIEVVTAGLGEKGRLLAEYHQVGARLAESGGTDARAMARLDRLSQALDAENGWEIHRRVELVAERMNLPADTDFSTLSTGLKRRTLLARALVADPDILMLDEPTNHLDIEAIAWLEEFLKEYAGTIVIVTHDRLLVQKVADRIIEIDRGCLLDWKCDYTTFLARREEQWAVEEMQNAQFDKKLAEEEAWLRRGVKARRTRNEGRVKALMQMREQRRQRRERSGQVKMTLQEAERSGNLVVEVKGVSFAYAATPVITDLTCAVMRGDRVGIIGPNGCGKTTLLRLLLGELHPTSGDVRLGTNLEIIYFDQLRDQLDEERSVFDNVADGNDVVWVNGRAQHVIGYLQKFLFSPQRARIKVKLLSGGERCRLLLARLFTRPANILVMDEPTNDLDIETLEFLEEVLLEFSGTLLLVSHDRAFLDNVVTSTLVFAGGGVVEEYVGGYSDWLRQRPAPAAAESPKAAKKVQPRPRPPSLKLSFKEERELRELPERIEALEEEKRTLYHSLSDPEFYREAGGDVAAVNTRLRALESELEEAYRRWQELEEQRERAAEGGKS